MYNVYMCKDVFRRDFRTKFILLLDKLPITDFQKETIKSRFVAEVYYMESDYNRSVILFIGLTNLVTIAGILITAFTTLTKAISVDPYWQNVLSWIVWTLSVMLTLANGWLTIFGIYKKYVLNDATLEKMYNEGWSFISGINRYADKTYDERFATFCSKIEQIITRTTIKQLSDNTAGVNVNEVMEVPAEKPIGGADVTKPDSPKDTVVEFSTTPADNISKDPVYRPRKKKARK